MASFVEMATLKLNDQSSSNIRKINNELKSLFATANKLRSMKIDLKINDSSIRKAQSELNKLTRSGVTGPKIKFNTNLNQVQQQLRKTAQNQHGNIFFSSRFDTNIRAAGALMARGFVAGIGAGAGRLLANAGRSAGQGITSIDDARAVARASGVNTDILEASATKAAAGTKGVSIADIMSAAVEQQGQLESRLRAGTITQAEYVKQLDSTTMQIAQATQVYGSLKGNFRDGAEQARQLQKVLDLMGANTPAERARLTDVIERSQIAAGGDVSAEDIKRKLQQLGPAATLGLTDRGLAALVSAMDEGGARAATNFRTSFQDLTRGNLNKTDKERQIAAGLRDASGKSTLTQEQLGDPIGTAIDVIIPKLNAMGVNLSSVTDVAAALDNQLGYTTNGAQLMAGLIPQINQKLLEINRARAADPSKLLGDQSTLRANLAEIQTSFQDAIGKAFTNTKMLDLIKGTAGAAGDALTALSSGKLPTAEGAAALASAGVIPAIAALLDPATAPLGGAALALDGSAAALTGAAAALTGAAGANAVGGALGGAAGGGILASLLKGGAMSAGGAVAIQGVDWLTGGKLIPLLTKLIQGGSGKGDLQTDLAIGGDKYNALLATKKAEQQAAISTEIEQIKRSGELESANGMIREQASQRLAELNAALAPLVQTASQVNNSFSALAAGGSQKAMQLLNDMTKIAKPGRLKDATTRTSDTKAIQALYDLPETGKVDAKTKQAVMEFQRMLGLKIDGIIGRQTDSALKAFNESVAGQQFRGATGGPHLKPGQVPEGIGAGGVGAPQNTFTAMLAGMDQTAATIQSAIGTSGEQAGAAVAAGGAQAAASILGSGPGVGMTIAAQMLATGPQIGATIAAAIANAAASVNVNVRQPDPRPNVGHSGRNMYAGL